MNISCGTCQFYHNEPWDDPCYKCRKGVNNEWKPNPNITESVNQKDKGVSMSGRSCDYCDKSKPLVIGETDDQGIAIKFPNYLLAYGYNVHTNGGNSIYARINYCPMCGRKFKK